MFFRFLPIFAAQAALLLPCLAGEPAPAPVDGGWNDISKKTGLVIYTRQKSDSIVKEYKAVGEIDAPAWVVKNVIDDVEGYALFMPYIVESSIVAREKDALITYQRFKSPIISDRDYVLHVVYENHPGLDGKIIYCNKWTAISDPRVPVKPGVIRVNINQGFWLIEPMGEMTRATYVIFTDPGGCIPGMLINYSHSKAIPKLFAAIQNQATEKKYRVKMPQ